MGKKKAFFRIGQDKAATTSLGNLISYNRAQFLVAGYFTPVRNTIGITDRLIKRYNLSEIDFFDPEKFYTKTPEFAGEREAFNAFINNPGWQQQNVFFSTETFWGRLSRRDLSQGAVRDQVKILLSATAGFFENHDLKIIIHLRRADRYLESLFNHRIKVGFADDPEAFFTRPLVQKLPLQSLQLLDLLEAEFGRENIIIKPFERGQMAKADVMVDMLDTLNIANHENFTFIRGNEALHRALAEVLFKLNPHHGKKLENRYLQEISLFLRQETPLQDQKLVMSQHRRRDVIARFSPFYQEVSSRYFAGKPLFLEALPDDAHLDYHLDLCAADWITSMVLHFYKQSQPVSQTAIKAWVDGNKPPW